MLIKQTSKLVYILYFTIATMLIMPLLHIPMILFNLPIFLTEDINFLVQELTFLVLVGGIPLLALFAVYKLSDRLKNPSIFFTLTFLLLFLISYFNFTVGFILMDTSNALKLLFLSIVLGLYTSFILTYFWKEIMVKKNYEQAHILYMPLLLTILMLFVEWIFTLIMGESLILRIYIVVGEFILKYLYINIFYIDFYGFAGVFLSLLASTSSLIAVRLKKDKSN